MKTKKENTHEKKTENKIEENKTLIDLKKLSQNGQIRNGYSEFRALLDTTKAVVCIFIKLEINYRSCRWSQVEILKLIFFPYFMFK